MNNTVWIIVTVDLENMNTSLAEGKYNLNLFSIDVVEPVLKIFSRFGVKAVFFASVFECCRFNKNTIRDVIQHIDSQGHDIQLHTHPFWCYGREHMWQYSLSEQIDIISHGCELLKEWTGRYPVAHRAGAYGINQNTLKALRENDIFIDSSMFHRYDNCKVTWGINEIVQKEGIVEVPVTGFFRQEYISLGCYKIKYKRNFILIDSFLTNSQVKEECYFYDSVLLFEKRYECFHHLIFFCIKLSFMIYCYMSGLLKGRKYETTSWNTKSS